MLEIAVNCSVERVSSSAFQGALGFALEWVLRAGDLLVRAEEPASTRSITLIFAILTFNVQLEGSCRPRWIIRVDVTGDLGVGWPLRFEFSTVRLTTATDSFANTSSEEMPFTVNGGAATVRVHHRYHCDG